MSPAVLRRPIVACLVVLLAGLAHRAAVRPGFQVVRVPLIAGELQASGRLVRVGLPDLTVRGDEAIVVTGRIVNAGPGAERIRVMLGGVVRAETDVPAAGAGDFAVRFAPGTVRALRTTAASGRYSLDIVGERDGFRVVSLEASNAYRDVWPLAAVVPAEAAAAPSAGIAVWAVLAALGAIAMRRSAQRVPRLIGRVHVALAVAVGAAFGAASLLPVVADRRVLTAPLCYWIGVCVLFAPALAGVCRSAVSSARRSWSRHPIACGRAAMFTGLVAMAVAQPIFEVLAGSPEFFIARNTTLVAALAAVALIVFGLPLVFVAIESALRGLAPAAATLFAALVVALLVALMVHPWLRRDEVASAPVMAATAVAAGAIVAWLAWRIAAIRAFLAALSPAAIVVPALFFGGADVRASFTPSSSNVRTPPLETAPPIVLIVFDEFPLHSLLDADHQIDGARFPGFAELARQATWFREATAVSSQTVWAVPAVASGRYPVAPRAVPTLRYYPENLFTLLADRYRMHVFGRFLQLCPERACERDAGGPSDGPLALLADLAVVWLHIVLPAPLTEHLPPVVGDWIGFARAARWREVDGELVRNDRLSEFDRYLDTMTQEDGRLYFLHTLLPHMPFEFVPSGRRYDAPDHQGREERGEGLFLRVEPAYADAVHQRHLLQVGFVDTLIGRLIARLRGLGIYDRSLIVVTADHGASYRERMPRRAARTDNRADILRVPLFIKRPGQERGAVADGIAESVDVLPSMADALGIELPFVVDGQSLLGDRATARALRTFIARGQTRINTRDVTDWRRSSEISLARRIDRFGTGPWDLIYALPGTRDLIGRPLAAYTRRTGTLGVRIVEPERFGNVRLGSADLPLHVRGRVFGGSAGPLAVAVNGRIAATTMPFLERGTTVFATMIPERLLDEGANDVETFVVESSGGTIALVATRSPD